MTIAIPVWGDRVSPVFDTATTVRVVSVRNGHEVGRRDVPLSNPLIGARAARLLSLGADVLICGAISNPQALVVRGAGVRVVPWVSGDADEVLAAYLAGRRIEEQFALPGRGRRRRRWRGGPDRPNAR